MAISNLPNAVRALTQELRRLPGIGPKSAQRIAFALLKRPREQLQGLVNALTQLHEQTRVCSQCHRFEDAQALVEQQCSICRNPKRKANIICIVQESADANIVEATGQFEGRYHILGGLIDPLEGVLPQNLAIDSLLHRISLLSEVEIIFALNPTMNGESTMIYMNKRIHECFSNVRTTRLARGLPSNSEVEYADEVTMSNALRGRSAL